MENNKTKKRRVIAPNFGKYPDLAFKLLEDEKKTRESIRKRDKLGIKTKIPKDIDEFLSSDVA
jgi:2-oxo-4-hydroxy-4-carboxy--5-ureidoimidazoline (OHCU) decarboxylase